MTKLQQMENAAREVGIVLDTWSPGDGATRYRFFDAKSRECKCSVTQTDDNGVERTQRHLFHYHNPKPGMTERDYVNLTAGSCTEKGCTCESFDPKPNTGDYFGGDDPLFTALGKKEAITWLQGRGARISR